MIRSTRLPSGLALITERIPTVRSVSVGVWARLGSRDEPAEVNGISHFVEHMLFKGTATRSNRDIAFAIDAMGGQLDAFTSKETVSYWAQVLDEHLPDAFALLADLVRNPRLDATDTEREREVILEEIAAAEDDPEDLLFESFLGEFWPQQSMGRPILGTPATVRSLTPEQLREHLVALGPESLVVAAAGNLEHERVHELVAGAFGDLPAGPVRPPRVRPRCHPHLLVIERQELEQVQLYVASEAPPSTDPQRYCAHVLNALLGGGVSSRLFQRIREERGLAYSVYSSIAGYSDTGYLMVSAGTRPATAATVIELVLEELERLQATPITGDELRRMQDHLKGALMLSLENTLGRMSNLARQEIAFGRPFSLDEIIAGIEAVTVESVHEVARRIFGSGTLSVGLIARPGAAADLRRQLEGLRLPDAGALASNGDSAHNDPPDPLPPG